MIQNITEVSFGSIEAQILETLRLNGTTRDLSDILNHGLMSCHGICGC